MKLPCIFLHSIMAKKQSVNSVILSLFRLALPIIFGNVAYALLGISDIVMAGMAGTSDLAGVSIGGSFFFPGLMFPIGMITALHPIVSRLRGAEKYYDIPYSHLCALLVCFAFGIFIMLILLFLAHFVLNIESDARMFEVSKGYITAIAFCVPIGAIFASMRAYCEAMGKTKVTLYFGLLALCYNIPLNYVFIFGKFGIPALGGIGCGVATLISMLLSSLFIAIYIRCNKELYLASFFVNKTRIKFKDLTAYLKLSLPLGLSSSVECFCFTVIALLLSPLGPISVSANSIAMSITTLIFNLPLSLGIASSIMTGYAIGKNDLEQLKRVIKAAYRIAFISIAFGITILLSLRHELPALFTDDAAVIKLSSTLLIFAACNQVCENLQTIQAYLLRGFKDTKIIFITTVLSFFLLAIPIGYINCYEYINTPFNGPKGFWVGIFSGLFFASILYRRRILYHWRQLKNNKAKIF